MSAETVPARVWIGGPRTAVIVGGILLAIALALGNSTQAFLDRAVQAEGVVRWRSRGALLVRVDTDAHRSRTVPVRRPWFSLPWAYPVADRVTVLYDPRADYDVPFFPPRARVASWPHLWLDTALVGAAGLMLLGVGVLSLLLPGRVRVALSVQRRTARA
jgi:hypothetical protein